MRPTCYRMVRCDTTTMRSIERRKPRLCGLKWGNGSCVGGWLHYHQRLRRRVRRKFSPSNRRGLPPLRRTLRLRLLFSPALMPVAPRTRTLRRKGVNHVHNLAAVDRGRGVSKYDQFTPARSPAAEPPALAGRRRQGRRRAADRTSAAAWRARQTSPSGRTAGALSAPAPPVSAA
jgi:hypothetical protein